MTLKKVLMTTLLLQTLTSVPVFAETKLAVYYGSLLSTKEREKVLKKQIESEDVLVFAKSKDFYGAIKNEQIPYLIAPYLLELERSDYVPVMQLMLNGKKEFEYKLVALSDSKIDSLQVGSITVGVLEEINRDKLKLFFKDNVGIELKKMNTVSKVEDLLSLLYFNSADAILISDDNYASLLKVKANSTVNVSLKTRMIAYPRIYLKKGSDLGLLKKLESLSKADLMTLGYDEIQEIKK